MYNTTPARGEMENGGKGRGVTLLGWMDAPRKSEKRADKYKFLVFFRQPGYGKGEGEGVKPPLRAAF